MPFGVFFSGAARLIHCLGCAPKSAEHKVTEIAVFFTPSSDVPPEACPHQRVRNNNSALAIRAIQRDVVHLNAEMFPSCLNERPQDLWRHLPSRCCQDFGIGKRIGQAAQDLLDFTGAR